MGGGGDGTGMVWQDDAKVREEKGRWRQNKTGDGNRTKQKQIGERRVCRARDGAAGRKWCGRTGMARQGRRWRSGREMACQGRTKNALPAKAAQGSVSNSVSGVSLQTF